MSVYNAEKYLRESIESILTQTLDDFEFIIINDASTDNTPKILDSFLDPRLITIPNPKILGLTKSINIGILSSKSKYLARMDADDISLPGRIEKQVKLLHDNPDIGVVGTNYFEIDKMGNKLKTRILIPKTDHQIRKVLFRYNPFIHSSIMTRKDVLNDVGLYDENFKLAQDYDLILRILSKYKGYNLQEELLIKRIDLESLSFNHMKSQIYYSILARIKAIAKFNYKKRYTFYLWRSCLRYLIFPYVLKRELDSKKSL